jgi:membrane protein DedA with SNARE-associated domain
LVDFIGLIAAHGYWIVLVVAFADQFGTPVPAIAILLAAGAVAGQGQLSLAGIVAVAWAGTLAGDLILYEGGRWRGGPLRHRLCSFSLAPNTCVRKTELSFQRLGWKALVVAKFVPGLALFAAPVAGALRMPFASFLVFDSIGAMLDNVVVIALGFALHDQLDRVVV